jgi:hypothetical protein
MSVNPADGRPGGCESEVVLLCMLELVGIIPFVGLLIVGVWDQAELGFGTLILLLVTPELVRSLWARHKARWRGRR